MTVCHNIASVHKILSFDMIILLLNFYLLYSEPAELIYSTLTTRSLMDLNIFNILSSLSHHKTYNIYCSLSLWELAFHLQPVKGSSLRVTLHICAIQLVYYMHPSASQLSSLLYLPGTVPHIHAVLYIKSIFYFWLSLLCHSWVGTFNTWPFEVSGFMSSCICVHFSILKCITWQ